MINARSWDRLVVVPADFKDRDLLENLVWWGYQVVQVLGDRAKIRTLTGPTAVTTIAPIACLEKLVKHPRPEREIIPVEPHPVGATVKYLGNYYRIMSIDYDSDNLPVYDLEPLDRDRICWSGDRVWHSLVS